jgi:hypothetical protein
MISPLKTSIAVRVSSTVLDGFCAPAEIMAVLLFGGRYV